MTRYRNIETEYTVVSNTRLTERTWRMRFGGDMSGLSRPGQFINILLEGKYLRRPISVSDYTDSELTILYDVVGSGTRQMTTLTPGTSVNVLTGLGNGFDPERDCRHAVLLGGGIGCAPLLRLAKDLQLRDRRVSVVLGFNKSVDVVMKDDFREIGIDPVICTVDGSEGVKGFVTDGMARVVPDADYFYACGPTPMLRALCQQLAIPGELSLEARMGCGFGACMCCSLETRDGAKRICKDGPVFTKDELIWK